MFGLVLARPSQNKLIWFSDDVLLFVVEWRQNTYQLSYRSDCCIITSRKNSFRLCPRLWWLWEIISLFRTEGHTLPFWDNRNQVSFYGHFTLCLNTWQQGSVFKVLNTRQSEIVLEFPRKNSSSRSSETLDLLSEKCQVISIIILALFLRKLSCLTTLENPDV